MEWKKIKNKYRKAWDLFLRQNKEFDEKGRDKFWMHLDMDGVLFQMSTRGGIPYNYRNLFDFFDTRKIFISVEHEEDFEVTRKPHWYYRIDQKGVNTIWSDYHNPEREFKNLNAKNRKETELAAFEKGFEILEKRLTK